jgi:plastocyanin
MATNHSQQFSARYIHTNRLFNIFAKLRLMFVAGLLLLPQLLAAQRNATVGAESNDLGRQDLAFLPNEIWVHTGDSIIWTVTAAEPHTVTFLTDGQIRPPFNVGCPGFSAGSATFDGSSCITTGILSKGEKFTVVFPVTGNFKLVCLIHEDMTGIVRVASANRDNRIGEPHHRERVRAGTCGYNLASTNGHAILRMLVLRLPGISIGQQGRCSPPAQTIVELLVVGQGLGGSENMDLPHKVQPHAIGQTGWLSSTV